MITRDVFENKNVINMVLHDGYITIEVFSNTKLINRCILNILDIDNIWEFLSIYRNKYFIYIEKNIDILKLFSKVLDDKKIWSIVLENGNSFYVLLLENPYDYIVLDTDFFIISDIKSFIVNYYAINNTLIF